MINACVVGWPIEHSRSPMIHGYWLKKHGIDGSYTKRAVCPDDAPEFFASLARFELTGCNVTVPLKEVAFAAAVEKDPSALAVGAANTLWLEGQKLCAANTDTYGFMAHLNATVRDWAQTGRPACIIGAGGAARAIVHGMLSAGVDEVHVINRTRSRADTLSEAFGPKIRAHDWSQRNAVAHKAGVIINTTTIGMGGKGTLDIDLSGCRDDTTVCDIVYVPLETQLLADAKKHGLRTLDGLGMLLHQAVPGFEKWFGVRPEVTDELRVLVVAGLEA